MCNNDVEQNDELLKYVDEFNLMMILSDENLKFGSNMFKQTTRRSEIAVKLSKRRTFHGGVKMEYASYF